MNIQIVPAAPDDLVYYFDAKSGQFRPPEPIVAWRIIMEDDAVWADPICLEPLIVQDYAIRRGGLFFNESGDTIGDLPTAALAYAKR